MGLETTYNSRWIDDVRLDNVLRNFDFNNRWSVPSET